MNNKFKIMLSLILALTLVMGGVASAATMVFYDVDTKTSYNDNMTDAELEELIQAYTDGNEIAKVVNGKLVNYADYKAAVIAVFQANPGKTPAEMAAILAVQIPLIVAGLPEVPVQDADITLEMEFSDADAVLTADGADNTIVTVTILKNGVKDKDFEGTVKFMSLKGAIFAKEIVSFDNGVAEVQLTSMSSALPIMDTIVATISDSPDDIDLVGMNVNGNILYSPEGPVGPGVKEKVFITYAESDRASDVFVKFNKEFTFADIYAEMGKFEVESPIGADQPIADIVFVDNTTVKLVFVEDQGNDGWLTDNSEVLVKIVGAGQPTSALLDSEIRFNLVDPKAPEALGVTAPDYRTIVTRFTEPLSETPAVKAGNWVLNGSQLVAADLVGGEAVVGRNNVVYTASGTAPVDNRNYVTLNLAPSGVAKLKAAGNENILQAYNIEDYAGITDKTGNNTATTQEFRFVTPALPGAPTAVITLESPEQYRVKFNQPLQNELDEDNFEVRYQVGTRTDGTPIFIGDTDTPATLVPAGLANPNMVKPYNTEANEVVVTPVGTNNDEYLLEFAMDWTKILETDSTAVNYYTPGRNHLSITVIGSPGGGAPDVESLAGIVMAGTYTEVEKMDRDNKGPIIIDAYQNPKNAPDPLLVQEFTVIMNEPIQMNTGNSAVDTIELTPSETQDDGSGGGVPIPTFQFISEDESITIDGELLGNISDDDMTFVIEPKSSLTTGIWTISIKSISDDVGNTADTVEYTLKVVGIDPTVGEPKIIWADAHDNVEIDGKLYDVVHIQFGKEMSLDALQSNIYTINGKILPVSTMVTSIEANYIGTLEGTLITITLPKEFLGDITETLGDPLMVDPSAADYDGDTTRPANTPHILNVSKQLKDADGNKIMAPTEVELPYNLGSIVHQ